MCPYKRTQVFQFITVGKVPKMKVLIVLLASVALASALSMPFELRHDPPPPPPRDREAREVLWGMFVARQDNFDPNNNNTFDMLYMKNDQFYTHGNPIFIMLGGEWAINGGWLQGGLMFDMAREHGAAMFYTEHRYYGQSFPVNDLSSHNLRFLTTEQALSDVAHFIMELKSFPKYDTSIVVVLGGSYAGNMAIWMRSKYPDLVHAAWSSSAPVLAQVDNFGYNEVISQSLSECTGIIGNGVKEVQRLLQSSAGIQKVSRDFNVCYTLDVNDPGDMYMFYSTIFGTFAGAVQYSTTEKLKAICNNLNNPNYASDYDKLAAYFKTKNGCIEHYKSWIAWRQQIGLNIDTGRQWLYQTCTAFGTFMTTTSPNQPFAGMPVDVYHMRCKDLFGPDFTPELVHAGVAATNKRYGGLNPDVTRVISTHGTYDPWKALGLTKDLNKDAPVIIIQNVSHFRDFGSISSSDNQPMKDAKMRIQRTISEWLAL